MTKSLVVKVLIALGVIIGLIIFNLSLRPLSSTNQKNFDSWLRVADARLQASTRIDPEISVSLGSGAASQGGGALSWSLSSNNEAERAHLLRILELASAAKVFDEPGSAGAEGKGFILRVIHGTEKFETVLTAERAAEQMNIQVLLRLFAEYAGHSSQQGPL